MLQMLIGGFNLCNLVHVFEADRPDCLVARSAGSLLDVGCFFQEVRHGRCFGDKGEGPIGLDGDHCRNWYSWGNVGRTSVELFAKVHRLDTTSTESRSDGWCRGGLSRCYEETLWAKVEFRVRSDM